jgi:DNA-binding beta-propeller fold protein YncE
MIAVRIGTVVLLCSALACMSAKSPTPALAAAVTSTAPAVLLPQTTLLVLSKRDRTLALVDPSSLTVLARVPVGEDPHEVVASADGATAYVSNYGHGAFHTLAVVDLVHARPLPPVELGTLTGPHGVTFVGGKLWFTAEGAKVVARYDPATAKVDWVMGTGQDRTHMLHVSSDMSWIATTNVTSGTVSILARRPPQQTGGPPGPPHDEWTEAVIPTGAGVEGFDVTPDGHELWAANAHDGTISVIDLAQKKAAQTIAANVVSANRLAITPDGKLALVSMSHGPDLVVFDVIARREVKRVTLGHGANGVLIADDGSRAFVACSPDNNVAVVDLRSLALVGRFDVGPEPDGMAWARRR